MPAGTHDTGEEFKQKRIFRQDTLGTVSSIDVGLYDDSTDSLTESNDIGDITTEPSDGNYSRQTINLDDSNDITIAQVNGDIDISYDVTFDVTDTTGTVDSVFVVVNFQSDVVNSESSQNDHLLVSAALGSGSEDLSNLSSLSEEITDTLS